jgi:UPF0176 protein
MIIIVEFFRFYFSIIIFYINLSLTIMKSHTEHTFNGFDVLSFYFFLELSANKIDSISADIASYEELIHLRGLIIIAPEGINGTVSCPLGTISKFTEFLENQIARGDWKYKFSASEKLPFKRLSIKIREEIVSSGYPELKPDSTDSSHLSPREWHEILSKEKEYYLIDVRNDYEVSLGTFKGAINPGTKDFKEFPEFVSSSNIPKDQAVYICCTGGIRCEKAYLEMKNLGYDKVYQLDGGILHYVENYPDGLFEGECFVFDDRVALDKNLEASKSYALCPHCGDPAKDLVSCKWCESQKKICSKCQKIEHKMTCSKNCSYHYKLDLEKRSSQNKKINMINKLNNETVPQNIANTDDSEFSKSVYTQSGKIVLLMCIGLLWTSFFTILSSYVIATQSPENVVKEAIYKMQEKGDPSPVVEYVDWDHMFLNVPATNKKLMKVNNPQELKEFYRKVLASPSSEIADLIHSKFSESDSSGEAVSKNKMNDVLAKLQQRIQEKEKKVTKRLQESTYEVGEVTVTGEKAMVTISHTYEEITKKDEVQLHLKEGKWYFTSLSNAFGSKIE